MKNAKKLLRKLLGAGSAGLLFQAGAVANFQPLTDTNGTNLSGPLGNVFASGNLADFVNALFTFALSLGAILAVLQLARAGWLYMGSDLWGNKERAKEIIGQAILGLLLLIGIYIVLHQINPCILNLNILQDLGNSSATCSGS